MVEGVNIYPDYFNSTFVGEGDVFVLQSSSINDSLCDTTNVTEFSNDFTLTECSNVICSCFLTIKESSI